MEITTYAKFDGIQEELISLLRKAGDSVYICVAWLSMEIYGRVLADLVKGGVDVNLIVNNDGKNDIEQMEQLAGVKFSPLLMRVRSKLMHNKFCIIDERIVITGSYNWSSNAEGHFENIVVSKNDFYLVKQFLHEFHDLASYHLDEVGLEKCSCKSNLFKLAVFGYESGRYNDSTVGIWSVCAKNKHVEFVGSRDEQYLYAHLGLDHDYEDLDSDLRHEANVYAMRRAFHDERNSRKRIQGYFEEFAGNIHGIGWVECINENDFYKGYSDRPEFQVTIPYRNAFFRKIVPAILEADDGDVEKIIDMHKSVV